MTDEKYLRLIENNLIDKFCYLPKELGFSVKKGKKATLINCSLNTSMFNIICNANINDSESADQLVDGFEKQPFSWWVTKDTPTDLKLDAYSKEKNFLKLQHEYAMLLDIEKKREAIEPEGFIVKEVSNSKEFKDFIKIIAKYDSHAKKLYSKVSNFENKRPYKFFIGYQDNSPLCIGALHFTKELAGIYDIITLKEHRSKGYGSALLNYLIKYAEDKGYKYAALSASSKSGFRIYKRLGFDVIGEFHCYEYDAKKK